MTARPVELFGGPNDGMQVHTDRSVLRVPDVPLGPCSPPLDPAVPLVDCVVIGDFAYDPRIDLGALWSGEALG